MKVFKSLWNDESGAIVSTEIVLVVTILGLGMIAGLTSVRNSVVTELADIGQAVSDVNQTYSYSSVKGHSSYTAGSEFWDRKDFCDPGKDRNSKCVQVSVQSDPEQRQ